MCDVRVSGRRGVLHKRRKTRPRRLFQLEELNWEGKFTPHLLKSRSLPENGIFRWCVRFRKREERGVIHGKLKLKPWSVTDTAQTSGYICPVIKTDRDFHLNPFAIQHFNIKMVWKLGNNPTCAMPVEKCEEDKNSRRTLDSRQPSVITGSGLKTQPIHMLHIINNMIFRDRSISRSRDS